MPYILSDYAYIAFTTPFTIWPATADRGVQLVQLRELVALKTEVATLRKELRAKKGCEAM
ncbi:hypothetical protein JCM10450v2_006715 [Rhodotorula kratochvilovae]